MIHCNVTMWNHIQFVTTAMHAYGHQWACQLAYNPHLCRGLGLMDGEGVERTWSQLRKLVGVVRTSSVRSFPSLQIKGVPLKESEISRGLVSPGQCPLKKKRFWLGNQQEMVRSGPEHQMRKFLNNGKRVSRLSSPSHSETCLGPTKIGRAHV